MENLKTLFIYQCNSLKNIFSPSLAKNLWQLQFLSICDCGELEEITVEEDEENQILFFQNLLRIVVVRCPKIRRLFAISVAPGLQKLEHLCLRENSELEEVFGDKDVDDIVDHIEFVLHQLERLLLHQLPSLTKFCRYHFIFPSLNRLLIIKGCPKISSRFFLDQDHSVHAKANALTMGKEDEMAEFPSEPSIEISCFGYRNIQESLPLYIEKDEQSINQNEEEINIET
ncbi:uncharacterized protein LOC116120111 [Pistacia vera]|uniref:uncharacterized protein LOC116120111 n=1 Tax=Pistacia vera TaxID=55513 RepID=UPI001263B6B2|nr:uncharacterized protein LOC116120111 [Pistacia vera]XP_031261913.1 uncharacterized protein LOC116120111 [Pistacia vera]XP_031261914.1 uncharacterized protein LOC116120111 [Pistacia vera]